MSRIKGFSAPAIIDTSDPEVMISQISALSQQLPLLYIISNVNTVALAYTHYNVVPWFLTLIVPIPMLLASLVRIAVWVRRRRQTFTAEQAAAQLRSMIAMTAVLGAVYTAWALALYPYGDAYAKCHVAFFMATTAIGTIFCLMHIPAAALLLATIVTIPFVLRSATSGQPVLTAMALDFSLIAIVLIFMLTRYANDFKDLVHSRRTLTALSEENFRIANQDSLTGLPNRRSFFADLETIFSGKIPDGMSFALALVDLDGFKPVNDVFGHAAGDQVLQEVGRRLRDLLGPTVHVARFGGDEFGLLFTDLVETSTIGAVGASICEAIERPIELRSGVARVSASIGFAVTPEAGSTWEQVIERADYALYHAKATQRGTCVLFSARHESALHMKSRIELALRRADLEAEMSLKFQPIVNVSKQNTLAYEALARWTSPLVGDVAPIDFIAAAERIGMINQLTQLLFSKALRAMATWPGDIGLSFNLSVRDLACGESIERLRTILASSGIEPKRIAFEITETALIRDFDQTRDSLLRLKTLGTKVALDDFGTGYSSLNYVHRLPLDKIKIDRSFIKDIVSDETSRDIVRSIIGLCRNLKITCVVEGVESVEQVMVLRLLGCTTMQGYFFGRPADNEDLSQTSKSADAAAGCSPARASQAAVA